MGGVAAICAQRRTAAIGVNGHWWSLTDYEISKARITNEIVIYITNVVGSILQREVFG
jgi:hypothetical protein